VSLRILFLDKSIASAALLVPSLERKGYEVVVVRTLNQAQSRLGSFRPDIVFINVVSFGRSGCKVCEGLHAEIPALPRIVVVAKRCVEDGGKDDERIIHPCTPRALLYRLAKIAKTLTVHEMRAGPLTFEPGTRGLRRSDQVFVLRPKEAALLTFFMEKAGRVLTRLEIIHAVWGAEYVGDTRTLSVHVRWLREKIEEDPNHPQLLRTVRGVGYRFEASEKPAQP